MEVYILTCVGSEKFFSGKFQAISRYAFTENPLKTNKYKDKIDEFLANCKNEQYLSCVEEGTEKLIATKLEVI